MKRILIVEPYYGGSHKQFLQGLMKCVDAEYTCITLPARKWKRRMQLAAPWVVERISEFEKEKRYFDVILCSTFVDVAVLRALCLSLEGWNLKARFLLYLHENQFAYPTRIKDASYFHFTSINFNSVLAADSLAFNSEYNFRTFCSGCEKILKFATDMKMSNMMDRIKAKSRVLYPGVSYTSIPEKQEEGGKNLPLNIVWNHRWEHDKNPDEFFLALETIKKKGIDFGLIVLGQSFENHPDCFINAKEKFQAEILHYGFAPSYRDYVKILSQGDIVISTAQHEFYGVAVIEAVRAGCRPLLPNRLSYPELYPKEYLYDEGCLVSALGRLLHQNGRLSSDQSEAMTNKYSWSSLESKYSDWLST